MPAKTCCDRLKMWVPVIILSALVIGLPLILADVWILPVSIYGGILLLFTLLCIMLSKKFNFAFFPADCESKRRLDGQWAVVTGANSGAGYETAKELVLRGCNVIITCRSEAKANATMESISNELKKNEKQSSDVENGRQKYMLGKLDYVLVDLCSKQSIDSGIEDLLAKNVDISILINNAGANLPKIYITDDGMEAMWEANYLAPFYFTHKLLPNIKKTSRQLNYGRIVNVASEMHSGAKLSQFEAFVSDTKRGDLEFWQNEDGLSIYGNTKCAQILMTQKLQELLNEEKDDAGTSVGSYLWVTAVHPGIIDSGFYKPDAFGCIGRVMWSLVYPFVSTFAFVTSKQGAQNSLHCALSDKNVEPGSYHAGCKPQPTDSSAAPVIDTQKDVLYQKSSAIWP